MKRNRRVGKEAASANLFITEFKLKASQSTNKEHKHRKMNTTLGNFKQILLQDDARKERQSTNGRQKPLLQQLKFKNKEDDFRPPQSITKRSSSKVKEESRLKFGNQTNDFFDPISQQPFGKKEPIDKSRAIAQYFASKPQKPLTQKLALKEKLQKTALEKFNSVALKENQQNQNLVSEKCAEVLYTLLKTARINKYRQGPILNSQPSEQNNEYYEQLISKNKVPQLQDNYLNHQSSNTHTPNSYFLKDLSKKNDQLFLESNSKPSTHQHQQSSFGLGKKSNQNHKNQIEEPRKSIYQKFDNEGEDFSQQSSFDDLDLKAQSSIVEKKDSISSKVISKGAKQQKKINNLPPHQSSQRPNLNRQRQQFKGAVGFNFVPKAIPVNDTSIKKKDNVKKEQKQQRPTQGELNSLNKRLEKDMHNIKSKEKNQSISGDLKIGDKGKQTKIDLKNDQKDLKKLTKAQVNIPQRKVEQDLYDIKNKAKIESIVGQDMISLKNKDKIQSIVDNFKVEDRNQVKKEISAMKHSIQNEKKKSNLLSVPSQIQSIPEAEVFYRKNDGQKRNQQVSSKNYISLNNNMIEKILTQDKLKKNSDKAKNEAQSDKISLPPPKLSKNTQIKNPLNSKIPINNQIDEDGIQQVNIGIKRQLFPPTSNTQKTQPKIIPSKVPQAQQKKQQNQLKQKIEQKAQAPPSQHSQQEEQPDELQDELCFYIEQIEDIGMYRIKSKDCYNDKSIDKELIQIHRVCAYYLAHQFLYLAHNACQLFKNQPFTREFYTISIDQLKVLQQMGIIDEEVSTLQEHLQESKKLLKKSYEQCKNFLEKKEQILLMDPKISYHLKCCSMVIKQFKKVYQLLKKNPNLTSLTKRCVYLINLYCTLRLLNGQQLKQYEAEEEIENLSEYVEMNKHLLQSQ